ncbi:class I SAM-dependent methyltransferase [Gracilibacillus alcaliphilus]|uniref:class I SAM-dependent methyltransferase n=1 Tax=Gracilibacillus alcaliphilus TaxID=1401441 RepID=UPI00195D5B88|nr:class I SAM-dependent methyltransferase [Gracilibacillus alcaliphilus]MBM7676698.1 putative methyltransferase [Gracilibacillus alcaliphilus]
MIITTTGRTKDAQIKEALRLSNTYNIPYIPRKKTSIAKLKERHQRDILVVGGEQLYLSPLLQSEKVFFHPSLAMIRAKRIAKGESDTFIEVAGLKPGMSLLDCTLGLASDSMIASMTVGDTGHVTGIEGSFPLAVLLKEGLSSLDTGYSVLNEAMRLVEVEYGDHVDYLQTLPNNSYDVVYFDPMFTETVEESVHMQAIKATVLTNDLSEQIIEEAKRVASTRVVLKDHWQSKRFEQYGFKQLKRRSALFHYGIIDLQTEE